MGFSLFINFDGECKEAADFYAHVFRSEVQGLMTFGEMPPDTDGTVTDTDKERIMYCSVLICGTNVMFSDVPSYLQLTKGTNVSLVVGTTDEDEIRRIYAALKEGGQINMELQKTFWSDLYAMVTDKFGISWQISQEATVG